MNGGYTSLRGAAMEEWASWKVDLAESWSQVLNPMANVSLNPSIVLTGVSTNTLTL